MRKFEIAKGFENENVILPRRTTASSAGYDFRTLETKDIQPGETVLVHTGVKAAMNSNEVLLIYIRSSIGYKRGLELANAVAVIDADYYGNPDNDGEIMLALRCAGNKPAHVDAGERIAQGLFTPYLVVDDDEATGERTGGYGSTGKN